jgi:HK97 family phage prohead protease
MMMMEFREVAPKTRTVECVASSEAIDSHGEVIDQASWKLDRYRANPVVLASHDSRRFPIGKADRVRVEGGTLRASITFSKATPEAEAAWQLVEEKILRGVSVGYRPGRKAIAKRAGRDVVTVHDCELVELSIVSVPSNPEALILRAAVLRAAGTDPTDPPLPAASTRPQETAEERRRVFLCAGVTEAEFAAFEEQDRLEAEITEAKRLLRLTF